MTENELLAELTRELTVPLIEADEVTVKMLCDSTGFSDSKISIFLKRKIDTGDMTSREVRLPNGRLATAYRKAQAIQEVE